MGCPDVGDTYNISPNVKVRCSWQLCAFKCPKGQQLNVPKRNVYCLPKNNDSPFWYPTINEQIKCEDKNDDNDVIKPKKCSAFPNKIEKDVTKSCSDNKCSFSCEDGKPNVKAATCFNGIWNVNDKVVIVCEGKTPTTPAPTPKPTTPEPFCDKKCQKKKKKEQNKKDKENNNNNNNNGEPVCDKKCQKKKKKEQNKKDKQKDKENKKKDKGNKDKGKDGGKKKNKKGKELEDYEAIDYVDYDEATTTHEPTTTQVFTTEAPTEKPKKKKNKKNLEDIDEIGYLDGSQSANAGYSPYAVAA